MLSMETSSPYPGIISRSTVLEENIRIKSAMKKRSRGLVLSRRLFIY